MSRGRPDKRAWKVPSFPGSRGSRALFRILFRTVAVLLIVTFATLALLELVPGGAAYAILGQTATPKQVKEVESELGLDQSLPQRYVDWVGNAVTGDLGTSTTSKRPVAEEIAERAPVTIEIAVLALLIALVGAIPLAIVSAYRAERPLDKLISGGAVSLMASPPFLTGLLLVFFFSIKLRVFPATGWSALSEGLGQNLRYAILPSVTLALSQLPIFTRVLRADLVETLNDEFILAARAKGLKTRRILFVHALRPSSFSLVTLAGLSLGSLIGGAVIAENIFAIPGLGQALVQAVLNKDFPTLQGIVLVIAVAYVVINAFVDLAYSYLDPRVRATA